MMNVTVYTIEIKVDGVWEFYKRTYSEKIAKAIMKAFGDKARISIFTI